METLSDRLGARAESRALVSAEPRILRVPYEDGAYWRKGAKEGPAAILAEFAKMREFSLASKRKLASREDLEWGTVPLAPYSRGRSLEAIETTARAVLSAGFAPVSLGGDHSITLPLVRALAQAYGSGSFGIIHVDAHSDTFDAVDGYEFHHGSVFRKIVEEGLVDPRHVHQFGLRGAVRGDGLKFADAQGIPYVLMSRFRQEGLRLRKFITNSQLPYYVSFDIDAIDPAFAPGTGTPVPGGLTSGEALDLVQQIAEFQVLGFDLVEVAPAYDVGNTTALLAAHLLFESLAGLRFCRLQ